MRSFTVRAVSALLSLVLLGAFTGVSAQRSSEDLTKPIRCEVEARAPKPESASGDFLFAVVGDTGRGCKKEPKQCELAKKMSALQSATGFTHLFLLGDNIYQWGDPDGIETKIFDPYKELSAKGVLIKGVIGNHDVISTRGSELQMRFFGLDRADDQRDFARSIDKQLDTPGNTPTHYRLTLANGLIEFFAIDSSLITDDYVKWFFWKKKKSKAEKARLRAEQKSWLSQSLTDSKAKWKVVILHHPMYSSADYHGVVNVDPSGNPIVEDIPKEMTTLRTELEPILVSHNVPLVLTGHDHGYEHIAVQKGVRHFVSGAGSTTRVKDYDRTKRPHNRFANFHSCGSVETSFMLFAVTREKMDFWNVGINGNTIDYGEIR